MKILKNISFILFFFLFAIFSCKKETQSNQSELEILRQSQNRNSYPTAKMDSAQAIKTITKQKVQELLDLSVLYASGDGKTEIDSLIYNQMQNYFVKNDSMNVKPLLKELESLQVKNAKINFLDVEKTISGKDTLDFAKYNVEYFDKTKRSVGKFDKKVQFILKKAPIKFVKEFKFYFVDFNVQEKDSTSVGVTK